jgi:hypothetical protein
MKSTNDILQKLRLLISSRKHQSGEVIIEADHYKSEYQSLEEIFRSFTKKNAINVQEYDAETSLEPLLTQITKNEAIEIITEAFRPKDNYSCILPEFMPEEIADFRKLLFSMFTIEPKYYKIYVLALYQKEQTEDESSFCIQNGILIVDEVNIGIFWVSDFY